MNNLTTTHTTDSYMKGLPMVTHTSDAFLKKFDGISHRTDANKLKDPLLTHRTDALLTARRTLGVSRAKPGPSAEFLKNAPLYISIGGGLSAMVGLPRIATWNTLGRPAKPKRGAVGFNTETKKLEVWNGFLWYNVSSTRI